MLGPIRRLHWAVRLVILAIAWPLSVWGLGWAMSSGTTSLQGVQGIQGTMILSVGLLALFAWILFGGNQSSK